MDYADFSIKIEPKRGDVYPVIVLSSPAGEARSELSLPFDPDQMGLLLSGLGDTVRASHQLRPTRDVSPGAIRTLPQQIGDQLFTALFAGPVRSLLDQSLGMMHGRQQGLRIKLHIDPEDPSLAQLVSLPWEFLYRKETRDFLNLSRFTPVLRYLDVQRPYAPLLLEPPLRVLAVLAQPEDCPPLDLRRERNLIENSIARLQGIHVEFMERATILALQEQLADQPYHVLYYMGHGGFDEETGRGVLLLEDEAGNAAAIDGSTLGMVLRDVPSMRLVFLNACETARVAKERGLDPFAGVASSMVMAGVPAVVAMQFPITDAAALTFSRRFYALLARGEPVDGAVAEGRRAIRVAEPQSMEWGTPVLYMRAPQGVIFRVPEAQQARLGAYDIAESTDADDRDQEKRLEQLYNEGLGAFWLEEWDKAVRSFQAIVDLRPDYQDTPTKLEHSKRQRYLSILYTRGRAAHDAKDWPAAVAAWDELVQLQPDYRDSRNLLQEARRNKQLADLYAEARQLFETQQWQAVVNVFLQIAALDRDYPDSDGLLPQAERQVVELRRQTELNGIFTQALRAMDAGQWQQARKLLAQVQAMEPGYRGSDRLLEKAEAAISQQEAERQKQEQITTLYEQALGLTRARKWRQVQAKMVEINGLDSEIADPEGLAGRADAEIAREEAETQRQNELASQYAEAVRLLKAERNQEALEQWAEIQRRDPRYPDRQMVQETARKKLNTLARDGARPRPLWRRIAMVAGGLAIIAILAGVYWFGPDRARTTSRLPATSVSTVAGAISGAANTPTPRETRIPEPPAAIPADPTLYDDFGDPMYENSYNSRLWRVDSAPAHIVAQRNGNLVVDVDNVTDEADSVTVGATQWDEVALSAPRYFEVRVMLDPETKESPSNVIIALTSEPFGIYGGLFTDPDKGQVVSCARWDDGKPTSITTTPIAPGSWHTIRLEAYPEQREFRCIVDGQLATSIQPDPAVDLSRTRFTANLGINNHAASKIKTTAYVDEVRMGGMQR